jgi:hypothetical protein
MGKLWLVTAAFILFFTTGNAQDRYFKNEKLKFSFKEKDSAGNMYIYSGKESVVRIDLYNDSLYGYHVLITVPMRTKFSAGKWKIVNDSLLVLQSDKRVFEKVFNRSKRQKPIDRYTFLDYDPLRMIIYRDKAIYHILEE